jgi:oligosaccharide reducing-end xylanase
MFKEFGYSETAITGKVNATFNKLFNGTEDEKIYVESGSDMAYILDTGNNDVRSEGMSYGMMICVQMNDKSKFDKLWKWAKTYMYNSTPNGGNNRGYFTWSMNINGTVKNQGIAPDGEFYFTTALLFASARWGNGSGIFDYKQEARQLLYDMCHRKMGNPDPWDNPALFRRPGDNRYPNSEDIAGYYMPVFSPVGASARHTDPSYHLPAFYEVWVLELENDWNNNNTYNIWSDKDDLKADIDFYKQVVTTSRAFFQNTTHPTTGLGPDYANFDGTPKNEGDHKYFEYDAWRIAMNIGMDYAWWAADSWQQTFADRIQAFFVSKGVATYGNRWTLDGTQRGADHSPGLVGCNAVASLAATHENAGKFIEDFWNISMTTGQYRYYDGCLYMMSLLHLSGNFKAYLSSNITPIPSSSITPTSAIFDKKTGLQQDITVTMTLNGNTLTSIKNGSTTLTSGTNYTISGNIVTIKSSYLAAQSNGTTTLTFDFSAGTDPTLVITIKETTGGGSVATGLSYNFTTDTIPAGYPTYSTTGLTAVIDGGLLKVTKTTGHSTVYFTLPFDVGTGSLADYSGIKISIRGSSGDYGNKGFLAQVGKSGSSATVALTSIGNTGLTATASFKDITVLIPSTVSSYTGEIEIGFAFDNTPVFGCEIASIELIPKP